MVLLLLGMKHSGKSSVAPLLAKQLGGEWLDLDDEIEMIYRESSRAREISRAKDHRGSIPFREIYKKEGEKRFRDLEALALKRVLQGVSKKTHQAETGKQVRLVIATGGGLGDNPEALKAGEKADYRIYIDTPSEVLYQRVLRGGLPAYLPKEKPYETFQAIHQRRHEAYREIANLAVKGNEKTPAEITDEILQKTFRGADYAR
jgi:shikimate kinase